MTAWDRRHPAFALGICVGLAGIVTTIVVALGACAADLNGLGRRVYSDVGFAGPPLLDDLSGVVALDFLDDDPALPRRFFSVRWEGFWYVPEAGEFSIEGAGDDRLDVWIDGSLVLRRTPPSEMHTARRTVPLDAGLHAIRVDYEQHGGAYALRLGWSRPGQPARALPVHRLFPAPPSARQLRLASASAWFSVIILVVWTVPAVAAGAHLARRLHLAYPDRTPLRGAGLVPHVVFALILLIGTVHNLGFVHRYPQTRACCNLDIDTVVYDEIAWNAARSGRFEVPILQPPGFVLFLAGVYRVAGHDYLTPKILFALMVSGIAVGIWWLGLRFAGAWEGTAAAGLVLGSPMFRAYAATLQYEILVAFLFLVTCLLLLAGIRSASARRSGLLLSAAALFAALSALTREVFLGVFPVLLFAVWMNRPGTRRQRLGALCIMTLLFCVLVGAWIVWQYRGHGQLVPISDKGPFNFWIGNNPNATGLYNLHLAPLREPRGWAFIAEQPGAALALAGRKLLYFWGVAKDGWHVPSTVPIWLARMTLGAVPLEWAQAVVRSVVPLLCLGGIGLMIRRPGSRAAMCIFPIAIAVLAGIHSVLISSYRFALPVLPYMFLFAAVALVAAVRASAPLVRRRWLVVSAAVVGAGGAWAAVLALAQPPTVTYRIEAELLEGPASVVADARASNGSSRLHRPSGDRELVGILPATLFPAGYPVVHISARSANERLQEILEVRVAGYDGGAECRGRPRGDSAAARRSYRRLSLPCPHLPQRLSFVEIWALGTSDVWIDAVSVDFQPTPAAVDGTARGHNQGGWRPRPPGSRLAPPSTLLSTSFREFAGALLEPPHAWAVSWIARQLVRDPSDLFGPTCSTRWRTRTRSRNRSASPP